MKLINRNSLLLIGLSLVALLMTAPVSATVLNLNFADGHGDTAIGWVDIGNITSGGLGADNLSFSFALSGTSLFGADSGSTLTGTTVFTGNGDSLCVSPTAIYDCPVIVGETWGTQFGDGTHYIDYYYDNSGNLYMGYTNTGAGTAFYNYYINPSMASSVRPTVPEPASLSLLGIGLVGLGLSRKRNQKA